MKGPQKDAGYAWMVCMSSFFGHMLLCSILYSRGMFYIIFRREFEGDSGAISLITSYTSAFTYGFAPVAGLLVSRFGFRIVGMLGGVCAGAGLIMASRATQLYHLYLTFGALTGIGLALTYNSCLTVIPVFFNRRLPLATGIAVSGGGTGFVVFQYFLKYLDDTYGWRGAFLVVGAIQLHCLPLAMLYGPVKPRRSEVFHVNSIQNESKQKELPKESRNPLDTSQPSTDQATEGTHGQCLSLCSSTQVVHKAPLANRVKLDIVKHFKLYLMLVKIPTYTLYTFCQLFFVTAECIIYTHLGAFALSVNHTTGDAALLFTVIGVSNTLMRIVFGVVAQKVPILWLCCVTGLMLAIITVPLYIMTTLPLLIFYAVSFGGLLGAYCVSPIMVTSKVIEPQMLPVAIGLQNILVAPGSLLAPVLAGVLYDRTGVYQASFSMASGCLLLASVTSMGPMIIERCCNRKY